MAHDVQEALALAGRVLLIEDGAITQDLPVTLPRGRGTAEFAQLEGLVWRRLLGA